LIYVFVILKVDEILAAVEEPGKMRAKLGPVVDASSLVGPISPYFVTRYDFALV